MRYGQKSQGWTESAQRAAPAFSKVFENEYNINLYAPIPLLNLFACIGHQLIPDVNFGGKNEFQIRLFVAF